MNKLTTLLTAVLLCGLFATAVNAQTLVGSYRVDDGPSWYDNPPTYSCVEACAEVFDGVPTDYACSTSDSSINNQALVSVFGISDCSTVAEDSKLGTDYSCGENGCAYSAYVQDNCTAESAVNYCYAASVVPPEPLPTEAIPTMGGIGVLALSLLMLLGAALSLKGVFRKAR